MLQKINRLLKYGILIGLILLAIFSVYYKYDNCSKCSFEYNGTKVSAGDVMILYSNKCLQENSFLEGVDLGNFTVPNKGAEVKRN